MNHPRTCHIELLESRIAPAGVVTGTYDSATGVLSILGDPMANEVSIVSTGIGTYRIEGDMTDITLNMVTAPFHDIGKLTSITFTGDAGADEFSVDDVNTLVDLTFHGDAGNDQFGTDIIGVKGNVTVDLGSDGGTAEFGTTTNINGNVTIDYGPDGGSASFTGLSALVKGAITTTGGANQPIDFEFESTLGTVGKGIVINTGAAGSNITINGVSTTIGKGPTGNAIEINGGSGADIYVTDSGSLTLKGAIDFDGGDGPNTFRLRPTILKTDGSLNVLGGGGADNVEVNCSLVSIKGGVSVELGAGSNDADFNNANLSIGAGLTVRGGANSDEFQIRGDTATIKGPVLFEQGAGTNSADLSVVNLLTLGSTLTVTGGGDDDTFITNALSMAVKGAVSFNGDNGTNKFQVGGTQNTFSSSVTTTGGTGKDTVQLEGRILQISGPIHLDSGANDDTMTVGAEIVTVKKTIDMIGGPGDDQERIFGTLVALGSRVTLDGGDGQDGLDVGGQFINFKGPITLLGGADADNGDVSGNGVIKGDVLVDLGASADGDQAIKIEGFDDLPGSLKIFGTVTATALTTDPGMNAFTDRYSSLGVTFAKPVSITLGEVESNVTMDNVIFKSTLNLDTGAGDDTVAIEQEDRVGPSSAFGLVTILLGAGADDIKIGITNPSDKFMRFLGGLHVDAGVDADADTKNDFLNPAVNEFGAGVEMTALNF